MKHILELNLTKEEIKNLQTTITTLGKLRDFMEIHNYEYLEDKEDDGITIEYSEIAEMADTLELLTQDNINLEYRI